MDLQTFSLIKTLSPWQRKNQQTSKCLSGKYLWASDMTLVDKAERARIEEVVKHLIEEEPLEFGRVFSNIDKTL